MKPVNLNPTDQKELYERACRRMGELAPGWSDQFPSDPAVAVLELASYLSDLQNRAWNRVGPDHYLAYLKLLGEAPRKRAPAALLARPLDGPRPYEGQRFWVDGVPYEVTRAGEPVGEPETVWAQWGGRSRAWEGEFPLCLEEDGVSVFIRFSGTVSGERPIRIWCGVEPEEGRVPPEEDTPPPVTLLAQTSGSGDWQAARLEDGTCGLLRSGYWTVTADRPFTTLRVRVEGRLEGRPRVRRPVPEPVKLEQRLTRSATADLTSPFRLPEGWAGSRVLRYFLPAKPGAWREASGLFARGGAVAGWSGQAPPVIRVVSAEPDFAHAFSIRSIACEEVVLEEEGILSESLRLMVEEGGLWYDCPIREPDPQQTLPRGCRWEEGRRTLCFGNGRDFRLPAGGGLLVAACATTLGTGGNGAAGILSQGGTRLLALDPAGGGCDGERARDAFFRAAKEQNQLLRAVTPKDYETLARQTPGLALGQVHAVARRALGQNSAGITVLAKPRARERLPALTPWQAARLGAWLERYRMIGVPVAVRSPRYVPLAVSASLRVSQPVDQETVRRTVLELTDGVEGPVPFGAEVSDTALLAALGRLEHILAVTGLELRLLSGQVRPARDGVIRLEPDMLPYLEKLEITQA